MLPPVHKTVLQLSPALKAMPLVLGRAHTLANCIFIVVALVAGLLQPTAYQQTLRRPFALGGIGLHTGEYALVRVLPAFAGDGRYFVHVPLGTNSRHWALEQPEVQDLKGGVVNAACAAVLPLAPAPRGPPPPPPPPRTQSIHLKQACKAAEASAGAKLMKDGGEDGLHAKLFFEFLEVTFPGAA